ncbi:phosphoribosyltransferase family protein [Mesobacterium pallidum]|uniref:phosphoribosyltransferase family protein n=1 Tax=Mesobacterium pallidum TaxID=2872037 RepID=UPI001EE25405|nr:phosphoribosyltransferase family protein [Mesobacterium pallidum]
MVETAILHIGMHKTGTTAIQASFAGYDDGQLFTARLSEPNHSIPVSTAFLTDHRAYHIWTNKGTPAAEIDAHRTADRATLEAELTRPDRETVLISGEDIGMIDPAGQAALIAFLRERVRTIRVICYLRDPASFACSSFQQRVKAGLDKVPAKSRPRYRARMGVFLEALGREAVEAVAYDRAAFPGGSVVQDFAVRIGADAARLTDTRANDKLSLPATRLILHFNRTCPLSLGDPALFRARQALVSTVARAYRRAERLDPARFAAMADVSDMAWLKDTFGLTLPVPGKAPPVAPYLETLDDIDPTPLRATLEAAGVDTPFRAPPQMLHRLYYHLVAQQSATSAGPELAPADGIVLRDVALKHETGARITRAEAIHLMEMASRARPDGVYIRKLLDRLNMVEDEAELS